MSATLPRDIGRELAALRERAYGPDADIAMDPGATARLAELEALVREGEISAARQSKTDDTADTPLTTSGGGVLSGADGAGAGDNPSLGTETSAEEPLLPPPAAAWWRHPGVFGAAGLALAVGLGLGLALPAVWTDRPDFIAGVDRDAPVDPTEAWIRQAERALDVDAGNLRQYEQVQGVTMWTGTNAVGARCLIVAWGELWGNGSCTPAPLDPVVDFRVNPDIPMPLAAPLDEGGVVRFVARGDVVEIWVREPTDTGSDLSAS